MGSRFVALWYCRAEPRTKRCATSARSITGVRVTRAQPHDEFRPAARTNRRIVARLVMTGRAGDVWLWGLELTYLWPAVWSAPAVCAATVLRFWTILKASTVYVTLRSSDTHVHSSTITITVCATPVVPL